MTRYVCPFPRLNEDVLTKKRTLFHLPSCAFDGIPSPAPDDSMWILPIDDVGKSTVPVVASVVITSATQVHLADSMTEDGDWLLLNLPRGSSARDAESLLAYSQRWDAANPDAPWATNPLVWRLEFRYDDLAVFAMWRWARVDLDAPAFALADDSTGKDKP